MKTQMRFQKILILISLIIAALSFVYALSFNGGTIYQYEVFYEDYDTVEALFNASQTYNDILIWLSIVFILVTVVNYIMATNKRRNYYVTNYVSIILTVVYGLAFAAVLVYFVLDTYQLFVQVDVEELRYVYDDLYGEGSFKYSIINFIMGYIMAGVIVADAGLLIFNLVWKVKLMKGEKKLLEAQPVQNIEVTEEAV